MPRSRRAMAKARSRLAGVVAVAGEQAREVVGQHRRTGVLGVERLVGGDRPVDVALLLQLPGLGEEQRRAVGRRREPGVERRRGLGGAALAGEEAVERQVRLGQGRGGGDHRPVAGLGGGGVAGLEVEPGQQQPRRHARRILGEHVAEIAAGGGGVAGRDIILHQPGHRRGVAAVGATVGAGQALERGGGVRGTALAVEARGFQVRRHRPGRGVVLLAAAARPPGRRAPSPCARAGCGRAVAAARDRRAPCAARRRRRSRPGRSCRPAAGSGRSAGFPPAPGPRPRPPAPAARRRARGCRRGRARSR